MPSIFEINSAKDLFEILDSRFEIYCDESIKNTDDLLFVIMLINHLREWIAPGYRPENGEWPEADTSAKQFSRKVYDDPNFSIIRKLCNGTKHATLKVLTDVEYNSNILAWENLAAVKSLLLGVPAAHIVDGQRIETYIDPIMKMYREWFAEDKTKT